jgi:hypothetical protein
MTEQRNITASPFPLQKSLRDISNTRLEDSFLVLAAAVSTASSLNSSARPMGHSITFALSVQKFTYQY